MKMKIFNPCNERGNSFVEYFVLAMAVLLATVAFFQGNFSSIQTTVSDAFQSMVQQTLR